MKKLLSLSVVMSFFATLMLPLVVAAATIMVVKPSNTQGWSTADTRPGGNVNFINDTTSPAPPGALQLTTDATTAAKAQYMHPAPLVPLNEVTDLSFYTKQVSGPAEADPSYQLQICLTGFNGTSCNANTETVANNATSFTTLVYEPYHNDNATPVAANVWQLWDADTGQWWSSRTANCGAETEKAVQAGGGGAPFYTLGALATACPNAVVLSFGVNIGSNNPSYNVETDLVTFNGTAYNFEQTLSPADKDSCKNDDWKNFNTPTFKNQGDCVSFATRTKSSNTTLNSNSIDGIHIPTINGGLYKITLSGTWTNRSGEVVDAECTSWNSGAWKNEVNGNGGPAYSPNLLDVQVNEQFIDWGACQQANHTYTTWVEGNGNPINLRVFDGDTDTNQQISDWFSDNNGTFNVTVVAYPKN
jgi:hypothetical protein